MYDLSKLLIINPMGKEFLLVLIIRIRWRCSTWSFSLILILGRSSAQVDCHVPFVEYKQSLSVLNVNWEAFACSNPNLGLIHHQILNQKRPPHHPVSEWSLQLADLNNSAQQLKKWEKCSAQPEWCGPRKTKNGSKSLHDPNGKPWWDYGRRWCHLLWKHFEPDGHHYRAQRWAHFRVSNWC